MENKVLYGIKNVHISKLTEKDGQITYGEPFALPELEDFHQIHKGKSLNGMRII